jgi:hypothetical protein
MTTVFRRFDAVAIACAVVALASEAAVGLFLSGGKKREDLARIFAILGASGLATLEALWLSPAIQALHQAGAVRRMGEAGEALDRFHRLAEGCAKLELLLLAIVLVLFVRRVMRGVFGTGRAWGLNIAGVCTVASPSASILLRKIRADRRGGRALESYCSGRKIIPTNPLTESRRHMYFPRAFTPIWTAQGHCECILNSSFIAAAPHGSTHDKSITLIGLAAMKTAKAPGGDGNE